MLTHIDDFDGCSPPCYFGIITPSAQQRRKALVVLVGLPQGRLLITWSKSKDTSVTKPHKATNAPKFVALFLCRIYLMPNKKDKSAELSF